MRRIVQAPAIAQLADAQLAMRKSCWLPGIRSSGKQYKGFKPASLPKSSDLDAVRQVSAQGLKDSEIWRAATGT